MTPSISAYAAEQKHATFLTGFHGVLHHPQCSCKSRRLLPVPNRFRVGVASTRTSIVGCGAGPWDVAPYLHCLHPTVICSSHECVFFFRAKIILGQPILLSWATTTHHSLLSLLTRISYRLKQVIISKHSITGNLLPLLQSNPSNFQDRDLFQA